MTKSYRFIKHGEKPSKFTLEGRNGWALAQLVTAGDNGVTPLTHPALRWSAYVHNLRKMGIFIDTLTEEHLGEFAGTHGRYVLRSQITLVRTNS